MRTEEIIFKAEEFGDEEAAVIYAGKYVLKGWNFKQKSNAQNRIIELDREGNPTINTGDLQIETVFECLIEAPFKIVKRNIKREFIEQLPAWVANELILATNKVNTRITSVKKKN